MAPSPRKVLVTTRLFDDEAARYLAAHDVEVVPCGLPYDAVDTNIPDADLHRLLADASGWIVGQRAVTRDLLAAHPGLSVIARRGVGFDRVDVAAARALGRLVTIAAGANDPVVADHTLALILAVLRRLKEGGASIAAGQWRTLTSTDLTGATVGLVGFGRIGRAVARRLAGFDVRVLVSTRTPDPDFPGVTHVPLAQLLAESDVVSLHAPLNPESRHVIDAAALASMKRGAVLVNTSRGGLIDDAALLAALEGGQIAGAGLDVFEAEDDPSKQPVADALAARLDVVATAHAAGSTPLGIARGNMIAAECMVAGLDRAPLPPGCLVVDGR